MKGRMKSKLLGGLSTQVFTFTILHYGLTLLFATVDILIGKECIFFVCIMCWGAVKLGIKRSRINQVTMEGCECIHMFLHIIVTLSV